MCFSTAWSFAHRSLHWPTSCWSNNCCTWRKKPTSTCSPYFPLPLLPICSWHWPLMNIRRHFFSIWNEVKSTWKQRMVYLSTTGMGLPIWSCIWPCCIACWRKEQGRNSIDFSRCSGRVRFWILWLFYWEELSSVVTAHNLNLLTYWTFPKLFFRWYPKIFTKNETSS